MPALHLAHLRAVRRTARRVCRAVALRTQTPLTRRYPAPHAWATCVTKPSGTSSFGSGMACAEVATVNAKASAISLIIVSSYTNCFGNLILTVFFARLPIFLNAEIAVDIDQIVIRGLGALRSAETPSFAFWIRKVAWRAPRTNALVDLDQLSDSYIELRFFTGIGCV